MKKSRKALIVSVLVLLAVAGIWGFTALTGASTTIDPSKIVVVERGTMRRSVVATGRVEPITKVEIKSKANGIIEKLYVDVDQVVQPGQVLAELDRENLTARLRQARANLQAAEAAHEGAAAQLKKDEIQAESPDVAFAKRNAERAHQLFDQKLVSQSNLDDASSALEQALNRQQAAQGQLVISRAKVSEAIANVAQARAAVENAEEDLANATIKAPIRATVLISARTARSSSRSATSTRCSSAARWTKWTSAAFASASRRASPPRRSAIACSRGASRRSPRSAWTRTT
ncbi:MAG: hypothetical protein DMF88_20560 [Acidobacteria bacterium]|nr:MAG: hypothetical protein DMF88_20560 [Acidobacteriota bacterium]